MKYLMKLLLGVIIAITVSVAVVFILVPMLDGLEDVSGVNEINNKSEEAKNSFLDNYEKNNENYRIVRSNFNLKLSDLYMF